MAGRDNMVWGILNSQNKSLKSENQLEIILSIFLYKIILSNLIHPGNLFSNVI